MSTIEDILNVSDSDSDSGKMDTRGIDREGLLHEVDSDDDEPTSSSLPTKKYSSAPKVSVVNSVKSTNSSIVNKNSNKQVIPGGQSTVKPIAELLAALEAAKSTSHVIDEVPVTSVEQTHTLASVPPFHITCI